MKTLEYNDARLWQEGLRRFYERKLQSHWSWRNRAYYYKRIIRRLSLIIQPGRRVLDLGCSSGEMLASLQPSYGCGIDFDQRAIEIARSRHSGIDWRHGVIEDELQKLDGPFDYIILSQMVGELYDCQAVFREIRHLCSADTRLIVIHYSRLWQPILRLAEWFGKRMAPPLENWIPSEEIHNLLVLEGYERVLSFAMTLIPVQIPFVSEFINRIIGNIPVFTHLGLTNVSVARLPISIRSNTNDRLSVSIIVPARNEAGNIQSLLERLPTLADEQEVIFVEGHSKDDTWSVLQKVSQQYSGPWVVKTFKQEGKGKADAVRKGFFLASNEVLVILDADISVPPEELPKFIRPIVEGRAEFINGSRMVYPMDQKAMRFLNLLGNKFFAMAFTHLISQPIRDTLCGTKVLWKRDYQRIVANHDYFGDFDPFGDFELLFGAAKLCLKIVDVPVHYKKRTYGHTNISRFPHGLQLLKMCWYAARKLRYL